MGNTDVVIGALLGGHFRVEAPLASGGMGRVYRVTDETTGDCLALKLLLPDPEDDIALGAMQREEMLQREYFALRQLHHPGIIRVHDFGFDPLGAFYTMELLPGGTLRDRNILPWREVCEILRDVASSLAILHARRLVHRDVKAANLGRSADGRMKLLDFGAMTPMGVPEYVVGTPPYMAPELLDRQALDGRADLFALGALAYSLLTGQHAYPARHVGQLPRLWNTTPQPVSALRPEIPAALVALVGDLLQADRAARVPQAALVIERVCKLAGLALREEDEVRRAYLASPRLVGRDAQLEVARGALAKLDVPHSVLLLIEGERGVGRSRFLDACLAMAQARGAFIVRAPSAADASTPFATARALVQQLARARPELVQDAARSRLRTLLSAERVDASEMDRPAVIAELCDFWLTAARHVPIALALDDAEQVDEASLAMIASLARRGAPRPLAILLTNLPAKHAPGSVGATLRREGEHVVLPPLTETQTVELVESVFGEVDEAVAYARWIHSVSAGRPWFQMQVLEHSVSQGIATYEAGAWSLTTNVQGRELPASLSELLGGRVASLGGLAQALAAALATADLRGGLSAEACNLLVPEIDLHATRTLLDELSAAGILSAHGGRWDFSSRAWVHALRSEHEDDGDTRGQLHARIARAASHDGLAVAAALHQLEAGAVAEAFATLVDYLRSSGGRHFDDETMRLIGAVLDASRALPLDGAKRCFLQLALVSMAQLLADDATFLEHAVPLLQRLERDSGLSDYRALTDLPEGGERLQRALEAAQQRFDQQDLPSRGMPPLHALPAFLQMCGNFAGVAATRTDITLCERVPDLTPLFPLSPAVSAIVMLNEATAEMVRGRSWAGQQKYRALLDRLAEPDRAGLHKSAHAAIRLAISSGLAVTAACLGNPEALAWAERLSEAPGHRSNAELVRVGYYLMSGQAARATACRRHAQVLAVQEGSARRYPGATVRTLAIASVWAEDLLGVKRLARRLGDLAGRSRGIGIVREWCLLEYARMRGEGTRARTEVTRLLGDIRPGQHSMWPWLAASHTRALLDDGLVEQAVTESELHLAACEQHGMQFATLIVGHGACQALLAASQPARAAALGDRLLSSTAQIGMRGLLVANLLDVRTRIAIAARDEGAVDRHLPACVTAHGEDPTAAQRVMLARLMQAADDAGMGARQRTTDRLRAGDGAQEKLRLARKRIAASDAIGSRARAVLGIVLDAADRAEGHLLCVRDGKLEQVASTSAQPPPQGLSDWLREQLMGDDALATMHFLGTKTTTVDVASHRTFRSHDGVCYRAIPLISERHGESLLGGAVAVRTDDSWMGEPARPVVTLLADALLDLDHVDALTCLE